MLSQTAETIVPIIVWLGFHPFRAVQNHIGSGAGNPDHCYVRLCVDALASLSHQKVVMKRASCTDGKSR